MGEREGEVPTPYYPANETITSKPGRHIATTIAAILFIISGIFSIIGAIALLILGGIAGVAVPGMESLLGGTVAILGLVILVVGVLDFLAGYWLWKNLKKGGILGLILAGLAVITSAASGNIIGLLLNLFVIALIAIGWKNLT